MQACSANQHQVINALLITKSTLVIKKNFPVSNQRSVILPRMCLRDLWEIYDDRKKDEGSASVTRDGLRELEREKKKTHSPAANLQINFKFFWHSTPVFLKQPTGDKSR